MTQVSHNFEGSTAGTAFTAGSGGNTNTAGNSYFDNIDRAAGGVAEFSSAGPYEGSFAGRFASRGAAGVCAASWQAQFGTVTADHFGRFFFKTGAIPATNNPIVTMLDNTLGPMTGDIRLLASGAIDFRNTASTVVATSSTILTAGSWYRIEFKVHQSATVSYITVRIYADPTAAAGSFTEELNAAGATTWAGTANTGYVALGAYVFDTNWPSASEYVYFDAAVAGASDWVGPLPVYGGPVAWFSG